MERRKELETAAQWVLSRAVLSDTELVEPKAVCLAVCLAVLMVDSMDAQRAVDWAAVTAVTRGLLTAVMTAACSVD